MNGKREPMLKQTPWTKAQWLLCAALLTLNACGTLEVQIRVTPPSQTIEAGGPAVPLEAMVTGSSTSVRWAVTPNLGSLDVSSGTTVRYTPPAKVNKLETVTITATLEGSALQGFSSLTIRPTAAANQPLSLDPAGLSLVTGGPAARFHVTGSTGALACALEPVLGRCRVEGAEVEYTPPAQLDSPAQVLLTVGLEAGGAQTSAVLELSPSPGNLHADMGVSPGNVTTRYGAEATRFSAAVPEGAMVTWSLFPDVGTLSATSGSTVSYTPPNLISPYPVTVILTASLEGSAIRSSTAITVRPPTTAEVPTCQSYLSPTSNETLVGLTSRISYASGERLELRVSSPNGAYDLLIYKEGQASQLLLYQRQITGQRYGVPAQPYANGVNWPTSFHFTLPANWSSGLYNAILMERASQRCYEVVFVVRPRSDQPKAPIALLAADLTWQAYNSWGGASSYRCALGEADCVFLGNPGSAQTVSNRYAPVLSTHRPNPSAYLRREQNFDHGALGLLTLVQWLEAQGYSFDVLSETDLHQTPDLLEGYRVLVLDRHSEYWTGPMYDRLEQFLDKGGSLFNSGSNQIYWKTVLQNSQLEVRKDRLAHGFDGSPGGLWREVGRPEARMLGSRFTSTGADYGNRANYTALRPDHWALRGTGLTMNQTFGSTCSGWETDKVDPANRPEGLEVIARGNNIDLNRPGQAGADMTYYTHAGGGGVFSVGSLSFFSSTCRNDPVITRVIRNVFDRLLSQ
ncbi:MAG: DUF6605 domain-containing protein [Meiothermus sp.]|nr:DUF6605 domain-containing protein [Meiothermus sp.]